MREIEIQEFLDSSGRSPFGRWFDGLNAVAAARLAVALTRLSQGNFSNVEGVAITAAQAAWAEYRRRKGGKEHNKWH